MSWRMCIWLLLQVISAARRVKEQYDLNLAEQQMRLEAQIVLTRAHQPRAHANARARTPACTHARSRTFSLRAHSYVSPSCAQDLLSPTPLHCATPGRAAAVSTGAGPADRCGDSIAATIAALSDENKRLELALAAQSSPPRYRARSGSSKAKRRLVQRCVACDFRMPVQNHGGRCCRHGGSRRVRR